MGDGGMLRVREQPGRLWRREVAWATWEPLHGPCEGLELG